MILFNKRVDRLNRSALAMRMENPHYTLDYKRMIRQEWISVDGVTEDDVDAFILSVRLLIQDRDGFSIRRLAEDVYKNDDVPKELRDRFAAERDRRSDHEKSATTLKHFTEDRNFTNGELFEVLMYGGIAHASPGKVEMFNALTKQGFYSTMVCTWFLVSLRLFLQVVRAIREVNQALLQSEGC